ncbi:N-6 DNA methylase [Streptomyces sp. HB132]|uniref:N-6 DNA methylase n=1 Tax=Streptomyces sp. HB132 TaxID=767388 RepID=UPI001960D3A3|nr:N-6 DNA methylase [Streptomyces sp. HB132]MBM7436698.1 type I restriction enzyme M protein [Streptomyces sp. HB132]
MAPTTGPLVTRADIARRTAVRRPAVSNWQRRYADFPEAVSRSDEDVELFPEAEVQTWLDRRMIPANARRAGEGAGATYGDRFRRKDATEGFVAAVRALAGDPRHFGDHIPHDHYLLFLMALVHVRQLRPEVWRGCADRPGDVVGAVRHVLWEDGAYRLADLLGRSLDRCPPHLVGELVAALGTAAPTGASAPEAEAGAEAFDLLLAAYGDVAGGTAGELPTPPSVARAVAGMLMAGPPFDDGPPVRLHDPYCRAGEMLAASVDAVRASAPVPPSLSVSGAGTQAVPCELAGMNLAQRHQPADLRTERGADTGSRFDRVLTNPPFNARLTRGSGHVAPHWSYGEPPAHNANYDWLQSVVHSLSERGRACVVMPTNAASSAHSGERRIRRGMIEDGAVEALVALPPQLFPATAVAVSVWILKRPTGSCRDVFFLDATGLGSMASRTRRVLATEDTDLLVRITGSREERKGLSRVVGIDEIRAHGHSLSATAYLTTLATEPSREATGGQVRALAGRLAELGDRARDVDRHIEALFKEYGL